MRVLTKRAAERRLGTYGLPVLLWTTSRVENGRHQAVIADYTRIPGYTVAYAVAVYTSAGDMVDRFNVGREGT